MIGQIAERGESYTTKQGTILTPAITVKLNKQFQALCFKRSFGVSKTLISLITENRKIERIFYSFFLIATCRNISSLVSESASPQLKISCSERKQPMQISSSPKQQWSIQGDGT
jgi:hypothetical protein